MTIEQATSYSLPKTGGTLTGKLTITTGGADVGGDLHVSGGLTVGGGNLGFMPIGGGCDYWGATAPPGFLFAFGQAVSRTTYAALFAVLGTTFGAGNGTTTFNLPDKRGRSSIGKDDMGGTAASRVTAAISGVNGTTLGAAGGSQALHQHFHGVNDTVHSHGLFDAGHTHGVSDPGHVHSMGLALANLGAIGAGQFAVAGGSNTGAASTGVSVNAAATGATVNNAFSGITTTGNSGVGTAQNLPPGIVCSYLIYAGV